MPHRPRGYSATTRKGGRELNFGLNFGLDFGLDFGLAKASLSESSSRCLRSSLWILWMWFAAKWEIDELDKVNRREQMHRGTVTAQSRTLRLSIMERDCRLTVEYLCKRSCEIHENASFRSNHRVLYCILK